MLYQSKSLMQKFYYYYNTRPTFHLRIILIICKTQVYYEYLFLLIYDVFFFYNFYHNYTAYNIFTASTLFGI